MKKLSHDAWKSLACELPDEVLNYKIAGDFTGAKKAIDRFMELPVAQELKIRMMLEKELLDLMQQEFPYTQQQVIRLFQEKVPDFSAEDLQRLEYARLAEWIFIDGEKRYIHNIFRNVTDKDPKIRKRMGKEHEILPEQAYLYKTIKEMKKTGKTVRRFRMRASVRIRDEYFKPGMKVKIHLPIPAEHFQISDVKILEYAEGRVHIDRADSLYRAICFEDTLMENRTFYVKYEYTVTGIYRNLSERKEINQAEQEKVPEEYIQEQMPHIRFTPYLKALAAEITEGEKDPLEIARRIFDYVTTKVQYSYMKMYSLIPDIPQYCARNLRGDCGVQALLFITLCRICGVPARWQSGLYAVPGRVGPHDWAMFYIKEYGWLFADPSFGGSAYAAGDEERRKFYFGNLDPFRMAANNAFAQEFARPKAFMPIDPYDNQSGEAESEEYGFTDRELETEKELLEEMILE